MMGDGSWRLEVKIHEFHELPQIKVEIPNGMTKFRINLNTFYIGSKKNTYLTPSN